ncbi:hypothetical protein [Polynucleobacter sp. es-EL-1]|uniref:hypothetical protein n=1 Tax=Polynucleobacter sp. es-EL-1 TaxID=1855652 RepID=UPI001BFDBB92|nr:hypothetical protein [Polynucleobacter sp. es-EL-1]QWE10853.1 hypothetical protein FD974_01530 [Polynucleobacter sp. es-EL-1]
MLEAQDSAHFDWGESPLFFVNNSYLESTMSTGNIPKINLRNSLTECGQSIRKENAGKYQNYAIMDCKASIAAGKIK